MSPSPAFAAFHTPDTAFVIMDASTPSRINKFDGTNFYMWKFMIQMELAERHLREVDR